MKKLTLIVHANAQQMLADTLRGIPKVQGFIFTHIEGHGTQDERDPTLSARDRVVGYTPQVRVDIVLEEADVATVLTVIRDNGGVTSRGVYWVAALEQFGRL